MSKARRSTSNMISSSFRTVGTIKAKVKYISENK